MQRKQYALVERIYGSISAARAAWAEQALRERAREAARTYSRTRQVPQDPLFEYDRTPHQDRRS